MNKSHLPLSPLNAGGPAARPRRVLFVFAWLVVGGEETEVRLLAKHLDPARYQLEVVACFRQPNMAEQTHQQLEAMDVLVDRTPYDLCYEDTITYLAAKFPAYDLIVACQAVPDVYPALEMLSAKPPLIEHGGLVLEALRGPKHLTARYVGVCATIRDAAAGRMPGREQYALEIPSMVDLDEFDPAARAAVRAEWGVAADAVVVGWVGRLDRKKRVEDFIQAAARLRRQHPHARFVVIGGPDAFMPEYEAELHGLAAQLRLGRAIIFTGDRPDVPRLLAGLDVFCWLARGEGMPHVIAEAGAARLPVIATRDNGTAEQIEDGVSGLFVPHERPAALAATLNVLLDDREARQLLGDNLRAKVEQEYSARVVTRQWERLFDEVIAEAEAGRG